MTPKEKANELVCKYVQHSKPMEYGINFSGDIDHAIKCALICVDEVLEFHDRIDVNYFKEVKQEIENL